MSSYVTKKTPGDPSWLVRDRFGMFIHFGLYAMPARHEWIKWIEEIPDEKYDLYFRHFDPDLFDAKQWARSAKAAGMKYAVLTTKHHEGFCLFDSQYTDFKITNTPFGRDLVREFVDAFRAEGIRIGFYYSLIDWHHPQFPIDTQHPRHADPAAREENEKRDMKLYAAYMRNQVTELMTNYGKIDILWFDFSYPNFVDPERPWLKGKGKEDWESEELIATVRSLQPHILINNRADIEQDLHTPEQYQMLTWPKHKETGDYLVWEACQTFSGSWGYNRDENTWKSPKMLIDMLINTVSVGGNLLMNVGPTARGCFDHRAEASLKVFADWMRFNSRSIYNCTMAEPEFRAPRGTRLTQSADGKRLYIHLMEFPYKYLEMQDMAGKIEYAQFLHDGSEVVFQEGNEIKLSAHRNNPGSLVLFQLPAIKPEILDPVIEVFLK